MPITPRASTTVAKTTRTNTTVSAPTGTATGDYVVVAIGAGGPTAATITAPAGRAHLQESTMTHTQTDTVVYVDDDDAYVDRIVTNHTGSSLSFSPQVSIGPGPYSVTAAWQGDEGTTRTLRIPLAGIPAGWHRLYLRVPGGTDFELTPGVLIEDRS